ncbi:MAG TPA: PQQ-binding-like beta-propeller repeat protein [Vicinamibacterales bacterium]|nr:PQQ-binding-like beta-propeller repeat protein [Vicinamibacterales bacterium]
MRLLDRSVVIGIVSAAVLFAGTAFIGAQAPPAAPQTTTPAPAQAAPPPAGRGGMPGTESGWATFQSQCFRCHTNQAGQAPTAWSVRQLTPEEIVAALNRPSHTEGRALSDIQKRRVGEFMAGRPMGSRNAGEAKAMANQCTANPAMRDPASGPAWNGWGNDLANTRFQPAAAARLTAAEVSKLKLKWAFGLPKGETNNAQPTVVSGRVFMAGDNGYIYSLDAKTGCVYWSFQNGSIVRGSPMVGAVAGQGAARWAVFFGDGHANVFGVDAQTGRQLWKTRVDEHVVARITGGVKYYDGRIYVPLSGSEEFVSGNANYPCCTARGGVVALDASSGKVIWKTYNVDEAKPWKKNPNGVQLYGPAAGGVWNSPTIDTVRGALYVGTGDAVTPPESPLTDAVMALDLKTGKVLWSRRATENDLFMGGCTGPDRSQACPEKLGPDYDIGNSPILVTLPNGKRALFVGTKGADVLALDPDANGAVLFRVNPSGQPVGFTGRGRGGIVWGGATDQRQVFYGMAAAGLGAVQSSDGKTAWVFTSPGAGGRGTAALGAAPTAIPGVVFQGAGDGRLFAVSTADGKKLWEFDTAQDFKTINNVPAHGGAIATSGAVIVDGMVYLGSGYAISSGASAGNVLLAFGLD